MGASTTRSKVLTKGSFGRIFVIYLLIVVLTVIVSMIVAFVLLLPLGMMALHGTSSVAANNALQSVANFLSTSLVGPLATIAITLIYYDQRVRKEGFDLQLMMSTLEGSGPTDAASPSPAGAGI